jgi:hypothetical protein
MLCVFSIIVEFLFFNWKLFQAIIISFSTKFKRTFLWQFISKYTPTNNNIKLNEENDARYRIPSIKYNDMQ